MTARIRKTRSRYSPELGAAICVRVARGESLRQIAKAPDMPDRLTLTHWLTQHPDFAAAYEYAREVRGLTRPVRYSRALALSICARIAQGHSLRRICADQGMPDRQTLLNWMAKNKDFAGLVESTRQLQTELGTAPLRYSPERAALICERILAGATLRQICAANGMPRQATLFKWLARYPDFANLYTCARMIYIDTLMEDVLAIADHPTLAAKDKRALWRTRISDRNAAAEEIRTAWLAAHHGRIGRLD